jgi:hypothetical protein
MDTGQLDVFLSVLERREPGHWRWQRIPGESCWMIMYKGTPPCTFHIEASSACVHLHATLEIQTWAECRLAVYRYALRLNEEISGAKLGLSHDGQLALMVEFPIEDLAFARFETAVQMLLAYYQTYYSDIQLVAQDMGLARHVAAAELQQQTAEQAVVIEILE